MTYEGDEYAVFSFSLNAFCIPAKLTDAERDVVRAALMGMTNTEIAAQRGTSRNTVANQLRAIYAKLNISGRLELTSECLLVHGGAAYGEHDEP